MKNTKVIIIFLLVLTLTACKSDRVRTADHLSPLIIESHYNKDVNTSRLSKKEKRLFKDFLESQEINNKVVNISEAVGFSEESYESGENTPGIYKEGDSYYIKYTDLDWEAVDDDFKSHIVLNHKGTLIFRSQFPVLYSETKDKLTYRYRYYNKVLYDEYIDYYYKSIGDDSGLIIRYHNNKNGTIKSISLIYQELFFYKNDNIKKEKSVAGKALLYTVVGIIITAVVIVIFIKLTH